MIFDAKQIEEIIGYSFKDKDLLKQCFTHSSYCNENKTSKDNERLEFFGDAILDYVVTEYLFNNTTVNEGDMTVLRSKIVSKVPLQNAVMRLGIDNFLLRGNGEIRYNPNEKMFSSLFEAIVAGIYIDGGLNFTKKFIIKHLVEFEVNKLSNVKNVIKDNQIINKKFNTGDTKTELQELSQKHKLGTPSYQLLEKIGPDHKPKFRVSVTINGQLFATGEGDSKKLAEIQAASVALVKLKRRFKEN